ncbi:hypothetical protein BKA57DRAFT_374890, partial [Linnemannia elongata]
LVLRHQIHTCGRYCEVDGVCRFSFPKGVADGPTRFDPESNRFIYRRGPDDVRVNTYNPEMLRYGACNQDLQYNIGDKAKYYLTKYTTKGAPVLTGTLEETGTMSRVAIRYNCLGLLDMVYDILGLHLYKVSNSATFLPTDLPRDRFRVIKDARLLRQLDPDSQDLYKDD